MPQKNIIFLLFCFPLINSLDLKGQNYNVDSLFESIAILADTSQIKILKNQCWILRNEKPNVAFQICEKAYKLIEAGDYKQYKSNALNYLGVIFLKLGKLDSAHLFYQKALQHSIIIKDSIEIGYAYNNLGDFYFDKAAYTKALENVLAAYDIFSALDYNRGIAYCQNNLGEIYIKQNRLDKALEVLKSALELRLKEKQETRISKTKLNIAQIYSKQEKYDEAHSIITDLLQRNDKIGYIKGKAAVLDGLADIFYLKKNYKEALEHRKAAISISKKISNKELEIISYNKLGLIYFAMKKYEPAEQYFKDAKIEANAVGYKEQEMESYKHLSDLKAAQNEFEAGLNYKNEYIKLRETIYSDVSIGKLIDLETAYDKIRQEKEVWILEKKIHEDKLTMYSLISGLLLFSVITIFTIYEYQNKKKANDVLKNLNNSKDMFFSILAHDLKGPIINIKGMTSLLNNNYTNFKAAQVEQIIGSLNQAAINTHNLLIKLLAWSSATTGRTSYNPVSFMLKEEVDHTVALLFNIANKKNIKLVKKIDSQDIVFADKDMVSTILRNLITNAIKFSYPNSDINIFSTTKNNHIEIAVADNGVGMDTDEINRIFRIGYQHTKPGTNNEKGSGVGLTLCSELIKTNKGKIRIVSKPEKGSQFIFSLPKPQKKLAIAPLKLVS